VNYEEYRAHNNSMPILFSEERMKEYFLPMYLAGGLASEAGEVLDEVLKATKTGRIIAPSWIGEELGDAGWYWYKLCEYFALNPEEVLTANADKLNKRYGLA